VQRLLQALDLLTVNLGEVGMQSGNRLGRAGRANLRPQPVLPLLEGAQCLHQAAAATSVGEP
jgi:hypothetical protein